MQKILACIVAWRKVLPTEKCLGNQGELKRTETTKNSWLMQGYLSKVKTSNSPSSPYKTNMD